jgi:phosphoserine aminotransferase
MAQPYHRIFNFSAGPGVQPVAVLEQARENLLNYEGNGMSVMEMSHRGAIFERILAEAEADLRELAGIPDNYRILFLQGGASMQFSMVPINFLRGGKAHYIVTGTWGEKAWDEAKLEGDANLAWSGKADKYRDVPVLAELNLSTDANYVSYVSNETIQGVEFPGDPPAMGVPIVCDMSSDILSRPFDVTKYDLIYAGAQKNMGPAGCTVVIIKDEMVDKVPKGLHKMLDYREHAKTGSMVNTPPTWSIYMTGLVYKHLRNHGGITGAHQRNVEKAAVLYNAIDASGGYYRGHAAPTCRSLMNVTFNLPSEALTDQFVSETTKQGLDGLAGHRSVGGIRASIYNAFPREGCDALASFMADFAARNG